MYPNHRSCFNVRRKNELVGSLEVKTIVLEFATLLLFKFSLSSRAPGSGKNQQENQNPLLSTLENIHSRMIRMFIPYPKR